MRHPIIIWLSLICFFWQVGCAPRYNLLPLPPSEKIRAELGTIGVVSARFIPSSEFQMPAKGAASGFRRGAAKVFGKKGGGASGAGFGGAAVHPLLAIAFVIAAVTVGAVVGGIEGAATAESVTSVEEAEAALKKAMDVLKIQEGMRDHLLQVAQEQTDYHFVHIDEQGATSPEEEISYSSLAREKNIDTILEISVLFFNLTGEKDVNPPLALVMNVRTRLIRSADDTMLYDSTLEFMSGTRTFTEWAANDAQQFIEELDRAYQSLAEKIVDELFLLYIPLGSKVDGPK
jgi:hypothetical protein